MQSNIVVFGVYRGMVWSIKRVFSQDGHFCGYVTLPTNHVLNDFPDTLMDGCGELAAPQMPVHGGITYDQMTDVGRVIGFDCGHWCDRRDPKSLEFTFGEIIKLIDYLLK